MEEKSQKNVLAAERTMSIFEALVKFEDIGVSEIARITSIHKSTVFRFVQTLSDLGYLIRNEEKDTYSLSTKMNAFHRYSDRQELLKHYGVIAMKEISNLTGETIHLAKLEDMQLIYLHKIESTHTLRVCTMISAIGKYAPLYCTGLGKAMLAWLPKEEQINYIETISFKRFTPNTIIDGDQLLKELETIKTKGVSLDREENEKGIFCIAAPIFSKSHHVLAAISLSGPTVRLDDKTISNYSTLIKEKAQEITDLLNHSN
ncbi:MAG: IclR family transcriptional regulator [Sphaerochaetaceae bacterium]